MQEVDEAICEVMMARCADRHVDGHEYLTTFVLAMLAGRTPAEALEMVLDEPDSSTLTWTRTVDDWLTP